MMSSSMIRNISVAFEADSTNVAGSHFSVSVRGGSDDNSRNVSGASSFLFD